MVIDYSADDIDVLDVGGARHSAVCVASSFTVASTSLCDADLQFPSKSVAISKVWNRPSPEWRHVELLATPERAAQIVAGVL